MVISVQPRGRKACGRSAGEKNEAPGKRAPACRGYAATMIPEVVVSISYVNYALWRCWAASWR